MVKGWAYELGTDPKVFVPIEIETDGYRLSVGFNYIGAEPPHGEPVVAEFFYDGDGELVVLVKKEYSG